MTKCGCKVARGYNPLYPTGGQKGDTIIFCPLHAGAEKLREALIRAASGRPMGEDLLVKAVLADTEPKP